MGLKGDISEVASVWKTSSLPMKIWLVLSLFLATTQLASLSEVIAKWKGFILTGIEFYREYFRTPVASFISDYFSIKYSDNFIDFISIALIGTIALTRLFITDFKIENTTIREKLYSFVTIGIVWVAMFFTIYKNANRNSMPSVSFTMILITYILVLVCCWPPDSNGKRLGLLYLTLPPFIVTIFAAINLGLK